MKNFQNFLFALLCTFAFTACKEKDCDPPFPETAPSSGAINFSSLAVGQKSRYLGLTGEGYSDHQADNYQYTDDTLQLEIVGQDQQGFKVEERFIYIGTVSQWFEYGKDSVFQYYIQVSNETLYLSPINTTYFASRIFDYYTHADGLPLAKINSPMVEIQGWLTSLNYCECFHSGYTENYSLFGIAYPRLNVRVNDAPMASDGNGQTFVFSKENGIVRASSYSWWTQSGIGWDLLP